MLVDLSSDIESGTKLYVHGIVTKLKDSNKIVTKLKFQ